MAKHSKWYGKKAKDLIKKTAMVALYEEAELILGESLKEVPMATNTLSRTGIVTPPAKDGSVYISYGTPYAVKQHEDLSLRHPDPTNPISVPGRKAKFLEDPFNRMKGDVPRKIALKIRKALEDAK